MKITISKHFKDLIYPLTNEELAVLEQSILAHGVRDPLVVWENGRNYLIDGHHRKQIIDKHNIKKYKVQKLKFESKHDVINWIIDNQLGRRNATPEGISYLRGLRYKNEKLSPHRPKKGAKVAPLKTSEKLAKHFKVAQRTIYNDEKFADAIETISGAFPTPKKRNNIKHQILTRQINLSKKDIIEISELSASNIKKVISGKKELWRVKLAIEQRRKKRKKTPTRIVLPKDIKMYHGDCMKVLPKLEANSIDSALLDCPYGIGMMNQEWDDFTPSGTKTTSTQKAEPCGLSYEAAKNYQQWCSEWGKELLRVIKPGGHILCFCSPRMIHRLTVGLEDSNWQVRNILTWNFGTGFPMSMSISQQIDKLNCDKNINAPSQEWEGWQTHLKPSFEPILLARKPLSEKTVAENVIKWGTGGLNIDACRIGNNGGTKAVNIKKGEGRRIYNGGVSNLVEVQNIGKGRFPSNVILSEEAGVIMSQQAGTDIASYFYCPKPSRAERDFGCDGMPIVERDNRTPKGKGYMTQKGLQPSRNPHPTVKPVKLCQYLLRLITPPNGTVIDCFGGSGTTGMACANNNFKFILVEKEKSYYQIARRRIMAAYRHKSQSK